MKDKILAIFEVSVVFILLSYLFGFVISTPLAIEMINSLDGLLFPGYAVLLVATLTVYVLRVPRPAQGFSSQKLKHQWEIVVQGFFPIFSLSVLLSWIDWTQWTGAIFISVIEIGLLLWFASTVKNKITWLSIIGISGCLFLPVTSHLLSKIGSVISAIIYFYLFVALSEELLFRGYIQSRLNSVLGRPYCFLGIRWGWGVIISSVLFGFWHLGWQTGVSEWPHVMWTIFAGLIFGFVREKSESFIAPAILHGVMNYGPQAILFYLFWNG